jgi:hypothetical protein
VATRKPTITTSRLQGSSGLQGAAALATEDIFSPKDIARLLAGESRAHR